VWFFSLKREGGDDRRERARKSGMGGGERGHERERGGWKR